MFHCAYQKSIDNFYLISHAPSKSGKSRLSQAKADDYLSYKSE